jgi:hypothetical protein
MTSGKMILTMGWTTLSLTFQWIMNLSLIMIVLTKGLWRTCTIESSSRGLKKRSLKKYLSYSQVSLKEKSRMSFFNCFYFICIFLWKIHIIRPVTSALYKKTMAESRLWRSLDLFICVLRLRKCVTKFLSISNQKQWKKLRKPSLRWLTSVFSPITGYKSIRGYKLMREQSTVMDNHGWPWLSIWFLDKYG